jgi:hypothetical protein
MGPDPTAIEEVARSLDVVAAGVSEVSREIDRAGRATAWTGTGAGLFRQVAAAQSGQLARSSTDLRAAAAEVRRVAEASRRELATLHAMETEIRDAFLVLARQTATNAEPPWVGWPWRPDNLPPRGDPTWREAAAWLRGRDVGGPPR